MNALDTLARAGYVVTVRSIEMEKGGYTWQAWAYCPATGCSTVTRNKASIEDVVQELRRDLKVSA